MLMLVVGETELKINAYRYESEDGRGNYRCINE